LDLRLEQVVDVTKRLADVAGATGADLGGIATAFGQIQAKGRLQGEELLQLQERGVALQDELQ
jgi:tape measure domain-containing protein